MRFSDAGKKAWMPVLDAVVGREMYCWRQLFDLALDAGHRDFACIHLSDKVEDLLKKAKGDFCMKYRVEFDKRNAPSLVGLVRGKDKATFETNQPLGIIKERCAGYDSQYHFKDYAAIAEIKIRRLEGIPSVECLSVLFGMMEGWTVLAEVWMPVLEVTVEKGMYEWSFLYNLARIQDLDLEELVYGHVKKQSGVSQSLMSEFPIRVLYTVSFENFEKMVSLIDLTGNRHMLELHEHPDKIQEKYGVGEPQFDYRTHARKVQARVVDGYSLNDINIQDMLKMASYCEESHDAWLPVLQTTVDKGHSTWEAMLITAVKENYLELAYVLVGMCKTLSPETVLAIADKKKEAGWGDALAHACCCCCHAPYTWTGLHKIANSRETVDADNEALPEVGGSAPHPLEAA